MRSCARRSFDAATIFIAFVICCVFLTARIRRRRSISDGMTAYARPLGASFAPRSPPANSFTAASSAAFSCIVELLLLDDAA